MLPMHATRRTKDSVRQMRNIVTLALIALPGCWFPPINYSGSYPAYSTRTYTPAPSYQLTPPACTYMLIRGRYCQTCNGNTICP